MASKEELILILESCIAQFGEEWPKGSDDYFWSEADIQSKLQSLLWKCPEMWHIWCEDIRSRDDEWETIQRTNPSLEVRPGGKDKHGCLLEDRAPAKNGRVVDIWKSREQDRYRVCYPITDLTGDDVKLYGNDLEEARKDFDHRRIEAKRKREVPLIHREARAADRKWYDLALYEPDIARKMVTEHLIPSNYPGGAKDEPVLAVVEIVQAHSPLGANHKKGIESAFKRLASNIDQIDHGYLLIPVTTYKGDKANYCHPKLLRNDQQWIRKKRQALCTGASCDKVKVYWVSDHPGDGATWIS